MKLSIEDRLELHELPGRYGNIIDDRDWPRLGEIFTDDAEFRVIGLVEMIGLEGIKRYMDSDAAPHPNAHLMTNIFVDVQDGVVKLHTRAILPVSAGDGERGDRVIHGSYYDEVVKTTQGWRVKNRVFSQTRLEQGNDGC